jgi:chromatin remodeling complex protein RSC6
MPRTVPAKFFAPQQPDAVLAALVGPDPQPRTEITKQLWRYIKKHGLQHPSERRRIMAGTPEFRALIDDADSCTMFELPQFIGQHISPAEG